MPYTKTNNVIRSRLVQELDSLGMDSNGPRNELVNRLMQCGVYQINTDFPPPVKFNDTSCRYPNHSSVLIGNGATISHQKDEKLIICNKPKNSPLIEGNFSTNQITIDKCLNLKESTDLNCDTPGVDGDLRRYQDILYMYRSFNVHPGWYPFNFGTMLLL